MINLPHVTSKDVWEDTLTVAPTYPTHHQRS